MSTTDTTTTIGTIDPDGEVTIDDAALRSLAEEAWKDHPRNPSSGCRYTVARVGSDSGPCWRVGTTCGWSTDEASHAAALHAGWSHVQVAHAPKVDEDTLELAYTLNAWIDAVRDTTRALDLAQQRQREAREATAALEVFRERVRDEAIAVRAEMNWCLSGLNEHLANLDLEKVTEVYEAEVTLTVTVKVQNADGEDTVRSWIDNCLSVDSSDGDVEVSGSVDIEVNSVGSAD